MCVNGVCVVHFIKSSLRYCFIIFGFIKALFFIIFIVFIINVGEKASKHLVMAFYFWYQDQDEYLSFGWISLTAPIYPLSYSTDLILHHLSIFIALWEFICRPPILGFKTTSSGKCLKDILLITRISNHSLEYSNKTFNPKISQN